MCYPQRDGERCVQHEPPSPLASEICITARSLKRRAPQIQRSRTLAPSDEVLEDPSYVLLARAFKVDRSVEPNKADLQRFSVRLSESDYFMTVSFSARFLREKCRQMSRSQALRHDLHVKTARASAFPQSTQ